MPSILVVATDGARRAALVDALERRFGADYDVVARSTGDDVGPEIGPLAVALAPIDAEGLAALRVVGATHLAAKRIAVVEVGDRSVSGELAKATTLGQVDHYVGHPWASPEEELYPVITEALRIWSYDQRLRLAKLTIVDESVHGLGATLASLLEQNSVAVVQHLAHSPEGQALLDGPLAGLPLLALRFWGRAGPRRPDRVRDGQGPRRPDPPRRRPRTTFPSWAPGRRPGRLGVRVVRRVADAHREGGGRRPGRDELEGSHYLGFPWGVRGGDFAQQTHRQAEQLGAEIVATRSAIGLTAEGDVLLLRVERRRGPHPLGDPHGCDQLPANRNAVRRRADRTRRPLRRGGRRSNVDGRFRVAVLGGCNSSGQAAANLAGPATT